MPVEGFGLHRIWYIGGRYAYASASLTGYTDHIFLVIDMADPTHPMSWDAGGYLVCGVKEAKHPPGQEGRRYALHHAIVAGTTAYGSWRDGGLTLLDVSNPTQPRLIAHRNWNPPFRGRNAYQFTIT